MSGTERDTAYDVEVSTSEPSHRRLAEIISDITGAPLDHITIDDHTQAVFLESDDDGHVFVIAEVDYTIFSHEVQV